MRMQTLTASERGWSLWSALLLGMSALAAVTAILAVLLVITGHDVGPALAALWRGSLGSEFAITSATLVRAIPLILAGLAVALAFRAGVWNIGAEGQLLAGAAAATAIGIAWGPRLGLSAPLVIIAGAALAGALVAGTAGVLRARFGVLEIISTIMLNFTILHIVGYLVRGPMQEPTGIYPQSATLPIEARLPLIIPETRLHLGLLLAIAAAAITWLVLRHTAAGFRIRAVGANPVAARTAGSIDVGMTTLRVFLVSGALAGIAGGAEVAGVTYTLYETLSPGYGYSAIAVALLARLHPLGILASGTFLGALQAGGAAMQREAGVPSVLVAIVEAMLIIGMVLLTRTSSLLVWPADRFTEMQPGSTTRGRTEASA